MQLDYHPIIIELMHNQVKYKVNFKVKDKDIG
jgi:hypothetical protein